MENIFLFILLCFLCNNAYSIKCQNSKIHGISSNKKGTLIGQRYTKTGTLDEIGLEEDCNIYGDHIQQCIHISPIVNNKTKSGLRSCVFDYTIFDDPHYSINYAQICNSVGNTCKTDKLSNFFSIDSNFSNSPFVNKRLNTSIPIHKRYITKIMNLSDQATVCCCNKHGCNYEFTFDLTINSPIVIGSLLFIGLLLSFVLIQYLYSNCPAKSHRRRQTPSDV